MTRKHPIQPSWHPNAANLPFCSDKCPSRITTDADYDYDSGLYKNPEYACAAEQGINDCPEFCPECELCLPALYFGLKKGEKR